MCMYVNQLKCRPTDVNVIAAQQLEFSCQAISLYFFSVETGNSKLVTDCKSDEVMILSPTSAACFYNLMLSLLCRCPRQILKYPGNTELYKSTLVYKIWLMCRDFVRDIILTIPIGMRRRRQHRTGLPFGL